MRLTIDCSVWKSATGVIKVVEMVLDLICVIILRTVTKTNVGFAIIKHYPDDVYLSIGTFIGFLIIASVLLLTYIIKGSQTSSITTLEIAMCLVGCIFHISSGAVVVDRWQDQWYTNDPENVVDKMKAVGALAICNGIIYAGDTVFTVFKFARQ